MKKYVEIFFQVIGWIFCWPVMLLFVLDDPEPKYAVPAAIIQLVWVTTILASFLSWLGVE